MSNRIFNSEKELLKLCEEFLLLGQKWGFNKYGKKPANDFLILFGKMREGVAKVKNPPIEIRVM